MSMADPMAYPESLRRAAEQQGWSHDVVERAQRARVTPSTFGVWLWSGADRQQVERSLHRIEQATFGTLRVREATYEDNEKIAELFQNSPEQIGDWEVTVQRQPYAFAQFRLQENVQIQIAEESGIVLAAIAGSTRNVHVAGIPLSVSFSSAARVRKDARGRRLSTHVRTSAPACMPFSNANYWYFRAQNIAALEWLRPSYPDLLGVPAADGGPMPGVPVSVYHLPATAREGNTAGVRPARRSDTRACVALINRAHRGLDLFRPYGADFLQRRLDDPCWGPKPRWWVPVYGWNDYYVLEENGRIVACAGLWDRGRHVQERWWNPATGEERTMARTALMDFGFAQGREDAMTRLIEYLIDETHRLGRDHLTVPTDQLPALTESLGPFRPVMETWYLQWTANLSWSGDATPLTISRPYTDLAYW